MCYKQFITLLIFAFLVPSSGFSGLLQESLTSGQQAHSDYPEPQPKDNRQFLFHQIDPGKIIQLTTPDSSTFEYLVAPRLSFGALGKAKVSFYPGAKISPDLLVEIFDQKDSLLATAPVDNDGVARLSFHGNHSSQYRLVVKNAAGNAAPVDFMRVGEIVLGNSKRILLVGDSITAGKLAGDGLGYRKYLFDMLKNARYDIDFVGDYGDEPYEGHFLGGRRINAFYPFYLGGTGELDMAGPMNDYSPNIVAIHLGTNDINNYAPAGPYEENGNFTATIGGNMAKLINYTLGWNNGEKGSSLETIIVSLVIPVKYMDSTVYAANKEIAKVVTHFQEGKITGKPEPVILCDHFTPFYEYPGFNQYYDPLMADKLHPTTTGHTVMAQTYFSLFRQLLSGQYTWFNKISWETGITGADHRYGYQGVSIVDLLQDGQDDIFLARANTDITDQREEFYQNNGKRPFPDRATALGVDDPGLSRNGVFFDMENDGDLDIFNAQYDNKNTLYENLGNGQFREMAAEAGISAEVNLTSVVLSFDSDNDGDMDLLEVNSRTKNKFYINNGFGKFQQQDRGLDEVEEPDIPTVAATAADYDNDDDIDVYIVKRGSPNKLFQNDGSGHFSDVAAEAGVDLNEKCNGAFWADLDEDGDIDLVVTQSASTVNPEPLLRVYRNNGNGSFENLSQSLAIPMDGYSVIIEDFDNDGFPDILTTNQATQGEFYQNNGNWSFTKIAGTGAEITSGEVRGAATFDYENDGDIDLVAARKRLTNVFVQNRLDNSNNYLNINATGPFGGAGGFGSKIWLYEPGKLADNNALLGYREILTVNGHLSQPSPTQHFGLGGNPSCDLLARFTDGTFIIRRGVTANQTISISPGPVNESLTPDRLLVWSGDAQADTVGKDLPEPIAARVVNLNNQGVANIEVAFSVIQGDATLYPPAVSGADIWLEAESASLSGAFRWSYDQSASGTGLVIVPPYLNGSGTAELSFKAPPATYYGWMRIQNPIAGGAISIDLNGPFQLEIPATENWVWLPFSVSGVKKVFSLSGDQVITFNSDIEALQIDKFVFSKDQNFTPSGLGESGNNPNATDRQGIARRFVQLGGQSGPVKVKAEALINESGQSVEFDLKALSAAPAFIEASGGNNQTGHIGEPLALPLKVTVTDAFDNPVPGQMVSFVPQTGGEVAPAIAATDSAGTATSVYTPGQASSVQEVLASVDNFPQLITLFTIKVQGVADSLAYVSGDDQTGKVADVLPVPARVQLFTESGVPVANYQVRFSTASVGALLAESVQLEGADSLLTVVTDTAGFAQTYWKLGLTAGRHVLTIDAGALKNSPMELVATAEPAAAAQLLPLSGDNQTGHIQQPLPEPFVVRLMDAYNNPVPNKPIVFKVLAGNGHFSGQPQQLVSTDSSGTASAILTLGTMAGTNPYAVQAFYLAGNDTIPNHPVTFFASGLPGPVYQATILAGNNQWAIVNKPLAEPLTLRVSDEFDNPISGEEVIFQVIQGNGTISGAASARDTTDQNGIAASYLVAGKTAGPNTVRATVTGLEEKEYLFHATGLASDPFRLEEVSGNGQQGPKNRKLAEPLVAGVEDQYGNPIVKHPVTFAVQGDNGRFGSSTILTVESDSNGLASAYLTLGNILGDSNHVVQASSQHNGAALQNSPITFYASAVRGEPYQMVRQSEQNIIGAANSIYPIPITVQIVDEDNLPIDEHPVYFEIADGDGLLMPDSLDTTTIITDSNGEASVRWRLGSAQTNHSLRVSSTYNGTPLVNSPMLFNASAINTSARSLQIVAGEGQTGQAGMPLATPLSVSVLDNLGLPVNNYPVRFRVQQGSGTFVDSHEAEQLASTDEQGIARVRFILGGQVGNGVQKVAAQSFDSIGNELENSPVIFSLSATPGEFSPDSSFVRATSPVPANGVAPAIIHVTIRDIFGNPIPNRNVEIIPSNNTVIFSSLIGETNNEGLFVTSAFSSTPTSLTVTAKDQISGEQINGEILIEFLQTDATRAGKVAADSILYPFSALRDSVSVRINDDMNQPVSNFPVTFVPQTDNIRLLSPIQLYSDDNGLVSAVIVANDQTGPATLLGYAPGLENDSLIFQLQIRPVSQAELKAVTPSLEGIVTETLADGCLVKVTDSENRPIGRQGIQASSNASEVAFPDSSLLHSDPFGLARVSIRLGKKAGQTTLTFRLENGGQPLRIPVTVKADGPFALTKTAGEGQAAPVTTSLPTPLTAMLTDRYGNPIAQKTLVFNNESLNGGMLSDTTAVTNSQGTAKTTFVLGEKSGPYSIKAFLADSASISTRFRVLALPLSAQRLAIHSGDNQQGVAGRRLTSPLVVKVTDKFHNGVPGAAIDFVTLPGNGSVEPARIISDSLGCGATSWTLGPQSGEQTLFAINANLENSPLEIHATASSNTAPVIQVDPGPFWVSENQTLDIPFTVTDLQNDSVIVKANNLPDGAKVLYDSTYHFHWQPNFFQAGDYSPRISAEDPFAARSEQTLFIHVENVNRPPVISAEASLPKERVLGQIEKPQQVTFVVVASDPDNDPLTYRWYVNEELKATTVSYTLHSEGYTPGATDIKVVVSDMTDSDSLMWRLDIVSTVELSYFAGSFKAYQGNELTWETRVERDNLGFYVLRSNSPTGPFAEISPLIAGGEERYQFIDRNINNGTTYFYAIEDLGTDGTRFRHDAITIAPERPRRFALEQNYPNPFNSSTTIRFELPNDSPLQLVVYDVLGREVRTLVAGKVKAGYHSIKWDGTDGQGQPVAAGVYHLVLRTAQKYFNKKLVYLK